MQHRLVAGGIYLKHSSGTESTALEGCAVQVARPVPDQSREGRRPIQACKTVQDGLVAGSVYLKHGPSTERAAISGGAVEVTRFVHYQTCDRMCPIRA